MHNLEDTKQHAASQVIDDWNIVYGFELKDYNYKEMTMYKANYSRALAELNARLTIDSIEFQTLKQPHTALQIKYRYIKRSRCVLSKMYREFKILLTTWLLMLALKSFLDFSITGYQVVILYLSFVCFNLNSILMVNANLYIMFLCIYLL